MRIITISREFGSGGRELGKRLADVIGCDYYDSEIISAVAKNMGVAPSYVEDTLSNHGWQNLPPHLSRHARFPHLCLRRADSAAGGTEKGH